MLPLLLLALVADHALTNEEPLPDQVLAEQRGAFRLPGGLDIGLAVRTQTAVDGRVVLATVFTVADGQSSFIPYVPRAGETVLQQSPDAPGESRSADRTTNVLFDFRNGFTVLPGQATGSAVTVGGDTSGEALPHGLVEAGPRSVGGNALSASDGALRRIELRTADVSITHLAGAAFGSAIANSGNDRTIDTTTSVGIDLRNAGPDNLGSTFLLVGDLAADAVARRIN